MIKEAFSDCEEANSSFAVGVMLTMAVATSIDALAVGVSMAFLKVDIWMAVLIIGVTTAAFSSIGIYIGHLFGARYKSKAELVGGIILIAMGTRILVEHLFFA